MNGLKLRTLSAGDEEVLTRVAADVFDGAIHLGRVAAFLTDPDHHLIVAVREGEVVGQLSAVVHKHPDLPSQLYIDELGVTPALRRRGIARALLEAAFDLGRRLGCHEAWLATEVDNAPARKLYESVEGVRVEPAVAYLYTL